VDDVAGATAVVSVVAVSVGGAVVVVAAVAAVSPVVAVDVDVVRRGALSHLKTTAALRGRSGRRGGSAGGGLLSGVSTLSALSFHLYSPHARGNITSRPGHDAHLGERGIRISRIFLYIFIIK